MVPRFSKQRALVAYLGELGCQEVDSIYVDGGQVRGEGFTCWACNDRSKYTSAAWLAALLGGLGTLVETPTLHFMITEMDMADSEIVLGNAHQKGGTLEGSMPFEQRRQMIALFERWRNYGSWQFALSGDPNFSALEGFSTADVFFDVDLDSDAYGFVRSK